MKPGNSESSSSSPRTRSRSKGNGAAGKPTPVAADGLSSTDPILDDMLGLNRKAVSVAGRRIEFRRDGEFTTLQRRKIQVLGNERDELSKICFATTGEPDLAAALRALRVDPLDIKTIKALKKTDVAPTPKHLDLTRTLAKKVSAAHQALLIPKMTDPTDAQCNRMDAVTRELVLLVTDGDLSQLGPSDIEQICDLFFRLLFEKSERTLQARKSIVSMLAPVLPGPLEEPSAGGSPSR